MKIFPKMFSFKKVMFMKNGQRVEQGSRYVGSHTRYYLGLSELNKGHQSIKDLSCKAIFHFCKKNLCRLSSFFDIAVILVVTYTYTGSLLTVYY